MNDAPPIAPVPDVPSVPAPLSLGAADDAVGAILKLLAPFERAKAVLAAANVAERDLGITQGKLAEAQRTLDTLRATHARESSEQAGKLAAERQKRETEDAGIVAALVERRAELARLGAQMDEARREHRADVAQRQTEIAELAAEKLGLQRAIQAVRAGLDRVPA